MEHISYLTVLEVRNLNLVSLGWSQGLGKDCVSSGGSRGESVFLYYTVSRSCPHSLTCDFLLKIASLRLCLLHCKEDSVPPVSLISTLFITLGPPGQSQIILPSQNPNFIISAKFLLPYMYIGTSPRD